jgi:adenylosuccinate lyase
LELLKISPVDGRYSKVTAPLANYFSEAALIKYRVRIEVEYFIALCRLPLPQLKGIPKNVFPKLRSIYENFSVKDAQAIKDIEQTTNHDVKAVEYFIKAKFAKLNLGSSVEFVHFGLTSQDINNTAVPLLWKEALAGEILPVITRAINVLSQLAQQWSDIPMLGRTHGQPASPTRLGKELMVFVERLLVQVSQLTDIPFSAKFGGATGNFNAHHIAYPKINWVKFANAFVNETLGLNRSQYTTQIEHYDNLAAQFHALQRINTIFIDLNRDLWQYISANYFKQKIKKGEVGSSAMPHKVNPIDFENSEGNLGLANAIFDHLAAKLPVSRLQRDLTDSTVLRNIGVPLAHSLIAYRSLLKGLDKIILNPAALEADLESNWAVVAEGIQTILRRESYPKPYEALKAFTRTHSEINKKSISEFIDTLKVSAAVRKELKAITPSTYTGL